MSNLLQRAFVDNRDRLFFLVNDALAIITIISIITLVLETVPSLEKYSTWFLIIEWVTVVFFLAEYVGRLYVATPKRKYALSFLGIIDLVAILPTILGLGNFTFLKSARAVRLIRLLRMFRLLKITRMPKGTDPEESLGVFGFNILIYFVVLLFGLLVTGTLIYLAESLAESIPAGMLWSLKIFMGITVTEPQAGVGMVIFVITKFIGLLLLGLLVGVVGNVFNWLLLGGKKVV